MVQGRCGAEGPPGSKHVGNRGHKSRLVGSRWRVPAPRAGPPAFCSSQSSGEKRRRINNRLRSSAAGGERGAACVCHVHGGAPLQGLGPGSWPSQPWPGHQGCPPAAMGHLQRLHACPGGPGEPWETAGGGGGPALLPVPRWGAGGGSATHPGPRVAPNRPWAAPADPGSESAGHGDPLPLLTRLGFGGRALAIGDGEPRAVPAPLCPPCCRRPRPLLTAAFVEPSPEQAGRKVQGKAHF